MKARGHPGASWAGTKDCGGGVGACPLRMEFKIWEQERAQLAPLCSPRRQDLDGTEGRAGACSLQSLPGAGQGIQGTELEC
jgi:hypothetical protein